MPDVSKAGEHYLNFGWDQTPHVYSTSAQTLYNGVGTTALTLPSGLSDVSCSSCRLHSACQPVGCTSPIGTAASSCRSGI